MKKYFIGLAVLVLAFAIRIYGLTSQPIFADEAIYIRWAQVMRAEETLRFLPLSDGKQPFFMWMVIPFLKIFSDPLFAGRFVSVLTGIGTVIGIYFVAKFLFKSEKAALLASLIYGITPFAVFFDRMALVDSMLAMFAVWTFLFAAVTAKTLRLDTAMIGGFFLGGALLTKSPGLFFAILYPTAAILVNLPKDSNKKIKVIGKYLLLVLVSLGIGLMISNILRLGPNFHLLASRNLDYVYPYSHILESPLNPLVPFLKATVQYFWLLGPGALILIFIIGTATMLKSNWRVGVLVLAWITIPLLGVTEFAKVYTARYILFILPFVVISAGAIFLVKKEILAKIVAIVFIAFIFHSLYNDILILIDVQKAKLPRGERSGYLEQWTAGYGIKEVAEFVKEELRRDPDKKIVIGTEGYFGTLPDGLQIYLNDTPQITVIGVGLGFDKIPKSLTESKLAGNKTFLVINSSRLAVSPEKLGVELISEYPKALKPDGQREKLLLFRI